MALLSERGMQVIATETYQTPFGKLVIAISREQGREATHSAILTPGESIVSLIATKDARLVTLPFHMDSRDVPHEVIAIRATTLEAISSLSAERGGELLRNLRDKLLSQGIDFSKDFKRLGVWAEHRHDWKAQIVNDGEVLFSRRFHGLDNSLEAIDRTTHFKLKNGQFIEVQFTPKRPAFDFQQQSFN